MNSLFECFSANFFEKSDYVRVKMAQITITGYYYLILAKQ